MESARIKILFIIDKWNAGGRQRVLQQLIDALDEKVFEPVLLILSDPSSNFPLPRARIITVPRMRYRAYVWAIARILKTERPNVINTHLNFLTAPIVFFARLVSLSLAAVICTFQSIFDVTSYKQTSFPGFNKFLIRLALSSAARITTASEGMIKIISDEYDVPQSLMQRGPHPAYKASELYGSRGHRTTEHTVRILTVGRLAYPKDFSTILKSFARAKDRSAASLELSIVGDGEDDAKLQEEAKLLRLEPSIFKGATTVDRTTFDAADIFIFSSRSEGMPVVLIEALAAGLPVIATDCDFGPREVVQDGQNGFLVPVGDEDAMALAILRLSSDGELMRRFSEAGPESVKKFEVKNAVHEWQLIFRKCVDEAWHR